MNKIQKETIETTTLVAYENGKYVDSITTNNPRFLAEFRDDFKMCKVVEDIIIVVKPADNEVNFIKEIKKSKAFKLFFEDKEKIKPVDVRRSLVGDRYSPTTYLHGQLTKAIKSGKIANDEDVESYLNWIKNNWNVFIEE